MYLVVGPKRTFLYQLAQGMGESRSQGLNHNNCSEGLNPELTTIKL